MTVLFLDSGFGGLSVVSALRLRGYQGRIVYAADHGGFPYGARTGQDVTQRLVTLATRAIAREPGVEAVVLACNTASTIALPALRAAIGVPVVGVVPGIKPAMAATRSRRISVLATPGTIARNYTRDLIRDHAAEAEVRLVGAPALARLAEGWLVAGRIDLARVAQEVAGAFTAAEGGSGDPLARTDVVVLGCTHYPLIQSALEAVAPWPVTWIDTGPAIARRILSVCPDLAERRDTTLGRFFSTGAPPISAVLASRLQALGLDAHATALDLATTPNVAAPAPQVEAVMA